MNNVCTAEKATSLTHIALLFKLCAGCSGRYVTDISLRGAMLLSLRLRKKLLKKVTF